MILSTYEKNKAVTGLTIREVISGVIFSFLIVLSRITSQLTSSVSYHEQSAPQGMLIGRMKDKKIIFDEFCPLRIHSG